MKEPSFGKQALFVVGWIAILFFLALVTPNPANAQTRFEASIGATHYGSNNGVWYDSASGAFQNNLTPSSWLLSLRVPGWKASLVSLGNASNAAQWGAYERSAELADPNLSRTSIYGGNGSGSVLGLSIGKTYEHSMGSLVLGIEGGLFVYHAQWHETYWQLSDPATIGHIDVAHTLATPYAGISARYKWAFIEARTYHKIDAGLVAHRANQITAGISIPFGK